jgi:3-methyladenine DNA glycosylase AlkD
MVFWMREIVERVVQSPECERGVEMTGSEVLRRINELKRRDTASIRVLRRKLSKEIAQLKREGVMALALELVTSGDANARWVGYELVLHHAGARDGISAREVERLGEGMASWSAVDCFGCYVSGPAWREGRISDALIQRWARSKDRWWRRAALVSTIPLNVRAQGGKGDAKRTLMVCKLLMDDRDDMVVKALSWALRALSVREPCEVARFIKENEDRLAALVKREVRNKLATGLKNPRQIGP